MNRTVDSNMVVTTANLVGAAFTNARSIDGILANGLEGIPGSSGVVAVLAAHRLRCRVAMGLRGGASAAHRLGLADRENISSALR